MNSTVLAILKMLQALKKMFQKNEAKYTVIPAFKPTFTEVTDLLTEMEALQLVAVEETKSTREAVAQARLELANATLEVCNPMKSLANKLKDKVLLKMVSVSATFLTKKPSTLVIPICQNIYDKANELKEQAKDYNLTEAKLNTMKDLLAAFKLKSSDVGTLKGEINTSKRDVERLADDAMKIIRGQLDPMVASLKDSDPTAVQLWKSASHINKPPSTPTELLAMVKTEDGEAQLPIAEANFFAINGKTFTTQTNEEGVAQFKPIPFGVYDLKCEVPGYEPFLLKKFKVVRGKVNKLAVTLVKAA